MAHLSIENDDLDHGDSQPPSLTSSEGKARYVVAAKYSEQRPGQMIDKRMLRSDRVPLGWTVLRSLPNPQTLSAPKLWIKKANSQKRRVGFSATPSPLK